MDTKSNLSESIKTGFIDYTQISNEQLRPRLLINSNVSKEKVLTSLISELNDCDEFYFPVAFITNSGIASLINTLIELNYRNIKGKIVASQYNNFTEPKALERLLEFTNIELKIVTEGNFHAKGYIFKKKENYTVIIGSSNLTQDALSSNREWNLRISSLEQGEIVRQILDEFNYVFENAVAVNADWIAEYKKIYNFVYDHVSEINNYEVTYVLNKINPNKMQVEALKSLENLRGLGKNKALLISATGTGKTYLSAFDVKKFNPARFLFVIHRENIARAALKSYQNVFGSSKNMGILSGNRKDVTADFIFSTIQTLSRDDVLKSFPKDYFEYIIIDEVHRSGAQTYQKIIKYFQPKFLFGMSATPERTDGFDIYSAFDHNIAYELRLSRALEENMLCTFHYYGITDIFVNGEVIDENVTFNNLISDERVYRIIESTRFYGCDHGRVKGLIFCSRIKEAAELSNKFNEKGFKTAFLGGDSSEEEREDAIKKLESNDTENYLDYIFTVDIFNEGVDIPSINQIIMLRPTESSIIFVQQLGRGLRKLVNKEYLVVIDFIGNYANNFLIPIALYGDNSYSKDSIRKFLNSGSSDIPGASTINFDQISKQRIFDAINRANLNTKKDLVKDYNLLKYKLGKVPYMCDFKEHGSRDPYSYVVYSGSYFNFISTIEDNLRSKLSVNEIKYLEFYSNEITNAKRIEEIFVINELIAVNSVSHKAFRDKIYEKYGYTISDGTIQSCINVLNGEFLKHNDQQKYNNLKSVLEEDNSIYLQNELKQSLLNQTFKSFFIDALKYAIDKFNDNFQPEKYIAGFSLYQKYSRKDVCRILNWPRDESSTMYGYRIKFNTCPIFVTYEKADDIADATKYEDHFINNSEFSWMTRSKVRLDSKEITEIKKGEEGFRILLFVKKSDAEGSDFYYMGDMTPRKYSPMTILNNDKQKLPIVNIEFKMSHSVEDKIYNYIIS